MNPQTSARPAEVVCHNSHVKRSLIGIALALSLFLAPLAHADTGYVPIGDPYTDTLQLCEATTVFASLGHDFTSLFDGHQPTAINSPNNSQRNSVSLAAAVTSFNNPPRTASSATSTEPTPNATSNQTTLSKNVKSADSASINQQTSALSGPTPAFDASDFVTQNELAAQLLQLSNSLTAKFSAPAPEVLPQYVAAGGNPENPFAASNAIDNLSNVTITNANLSASEIPALNYFPATNTVSVGYGGTGTSNAPTYGQLLLGNGNGGYTLTATSSLGILSGSSLLPSANTWSALNLFSGGASTTNFSNFGTAYFGGTGTSSFNGAGALSLVSNGLTVGTNQLVVSGGDVGVGTSSPDNLLDIANSGTDVANFGNIASTTGYPGGPLGTSGLAIPNGSLNIWDNSLNGWAGSAAAFCLEANHSYPFNCQISGGDSQASGPALYTGRDEDAALIQIDGNSNLFGGPISGSFTATEFIPATPLSASQIANLRIGMTIDTNDLPTPYSGLVSGWDKVGGTYVTVQGWYLQRTTSLGTPAGTSATIDAFSKIFGLNIVTNVYSTSQQTQSAGGEVDCNNNTGTYNATTNTPEIWCWDLVKSGNATSSEGLIVRGNSGSGFENDIDVTAAAANAAIFVNPTQIDADNTVPLGLSVSGFTNAGIYVANKASGGSGIGVDVDFDRWEYSSWDINRHDACQAWHLRRRIFRWRTYLQRRRAFVWQLWRRANFEPERRAGISKCNLT